MLMEAKRFYGTIHVSVGKESESVRHSHFFSYVVIICVSSFNTPPLYYTKSKWLMFFVEFEILLHLLCKVRVEVPAPY